MNIKHINSRFLKNASRFFLVFGLAAMLQGCQLIREAVRQDELRDCQRVFAKLEKVMKKQIRSSTSGAMQCSLNQRACPGAQRRIENTLSLLEQYKGSDAGLMCSGKKPSVFRTREHWKLELTNLLKQIQAGQMKSEAFRTKSEELYLDSLPMAKARGF